MEQLLELQWVILYTEKTLPAILISTGTLAEVSLDVKIEMHILKESSIKGSRLK